MINVVSCLQVTIASQRRYVGFWGKIVEPFVRSGIEVHVPPNVTRELRRIRLYDTVSVDQVKFKITELQEVRVHPPTSFLQEGWASELYTTPPSVLNVLGTPLDPDESNVSGLQGGI